jgi:hypothetical protein
MTSNLLKVSIFCIALTLRALHPATAQTSCDDISSKIFLLGSAGGGYFDPVDYGDCSSLAACPVKPPDNFVIQQSPPQSDLTDLAEAFKIAPDFFKAQLCALSKIYIDTDTDQSKPLAWGLRERAMDGRTHIGLNQQVLSKLARNTPLVSYENYIACRLVAPGLPPNACLPPTPAQPIRGFAYSNADPDSRALAVLAILAHEVGHVIWWDTNVSRRKCLSWYFYQLSGWPKYDLPHRFRRFAMADSDEQIPGGINVFQVQRDVPSAPDTSSLNIARVYASEWAGLFQPSL